MSWDKELEGGLPDCRLKGRRNNTSVVLGRLTMHKVFCANCGASGGLATEWTQYIFYLCDECFAVYGKPPGTIPIPDEAVR